MAWSTLQTISACGALVLVYVLYMRNRKDHFYLTNDDGSRRTLTETDEFKSVSQNHSPNSINGLMRVHLPKERERM